MPGRPAFYASTLTTAGGHGVGVLVESHQGRPTKIEGNPDHPASLGATNAQMQAATMGLYDPDRSRSVLEGGEIACEDLPPIVGYENGAFFRRLFKRSTGLGPSQDRRMFQPLRQAAPAPSPA